MEYYLFAGNHLHLYPVKCSWCGIGQDCEFALDPSAEWNGHLDPTILQKATQVRLADLARIVKTLEASVQVPRLNILLIPV
jgi:hypothetical protein